MRKFNGSALVDYAIPTLVIGVALGCGFTYMHSNGLLTNFMAASSNMKVEDGKGYVGNNPTSSATASTSAFTSVATPDNPVTECLAGKCTINFGDFVLNDVEEDFAAYVASNGSAKGTDKLMAILEQLAVQLDDPATEDVDEGALFKDMANLGHFIARYEESLEDYADANPSLAMDKIDAVPLPANIASVLTDFEFKDPAQTCGTIMSPHACTMDDMYSQVMSNSFADILNNKTTLPALYEDSVKSNPMYAFYDLFDEVMSSAEYPDSAKKVAQEVLLSLDDITFNFQGQASALELSLESSKTHYDPLTGAVIESGITFFNDTSYLAKPQSSYFTDLDSAIICAAGKDIDTAAECH